MKEVLNNRTRHLTVVLEDIYQPHNASAVVRTCDCFGIQEIHIIENRNKYRVNPDVALGSSQWVDLIKYNSSEKNTEECITSLKKKGYRIVATTPHKNDINLEDYNPQQKTALMFGTEADGLSTTALEMADDFVKIPMYGFTESFNISVTAGICLHHLSMKLRQSEIMWKLSEEEKEEIMLQWVREVVKKSDLLEKEFLKKNGN